MSVGLLVIAHNQVGEALIEAASDIFKSSPLLIKTLPVYPRSNFEGMVKKSSQYLKDLDTGHGVLVLTDLFGSTPSNIANKLVSETINSAVIAGINLPMLIRIFNYSHLELEELAAAAFQGGRNGISTTPQLFDSNGAG